MVCRRNQIGRWSLWVLYAVLISILNHSYTGILEKKSIKMEHPSIQIGRVNGGKVASEHVISQAWQSHVASWAKLPCSQHHVGPVAVYRQPQTEQELEPCLCISICPKHHSPKKLCYYIQEDEYFMKKRNTIWTFQPSKLDCVCMCTEADVLLEESHQILSLTDVVS